MINIPYKQLEKGNSQLHPGLQFLIFTGLFLVVLAIGNFVGSGIVIALYGLKTLMALAALNTNTPNFVNSLWILQIAGTTIPILATPVFFAFVIAGDPQDYLKPSFRFAWPLILLVLAIMFISSPLIELLSNINQKMVLPPFLKWMRESEDNAQKLTEALLQMKTVWDVIVNVLLIGLLTAVVEEFMFRGCLQTIMLRWTKNTHAAIWITAILFSAFHMEFFGFLPRLLLGLFFGYFVAWSGSIWPGVWAHFINNGTAVIATYLYRKKIITINPEDQHIFNYQACIISLLIVLFLSYIYYSIALSKKAIPGN